MVARVLAGQDSYDSLAEREQAVVRTAWDERIASTISSLNLESELLAAGETWAEADEDGSLIVRDGK